MLQPTVFDLSVTEIAALRQKIFGMLKLINGQETSPEAQDALRASLAEKLATPGQLGFARPVDEPRSAGVCPLHGLPWIWKIACARAWWATCALPCPPRTGSSSAMWTQRPETLQPRRIGYP